LVIITKFSIGESVMSPANGLGQVVGIETHTHGSITTITYEVRHSRYGKGELYTIRQYTEAQLEKV